MTCKRLPHARDLGMDSHRGRARSGRAGACEQHFVPEVDAVGGAGSFGGSGWPVEAYAALGCGWVVRSHFIEYLAPALLGDTILIRTWVADMGKVTSRRRFLILREAGEPQAPGERQAAGETVLAKAETNWAFVDYRTGSPKRIPPEISRAFEVVTDGGANGRTMGAE